MGKTRSWTVPFRDSTANQLLPIVPSEQCTADHAAGGEKHSEKRRSPLSQAARPSNTPTAARPGPYGNHQQNTIPISPKTDPG